MIEFYNNDEKHLPDPCNNTFYNVEDRGLFNYLEDSAPAYVLPNRSPANSELYVPDERLTKACRIESRITSSAAPIAGVGIFGILGCLGLAESSPIASVLFWISVTMVAMSFVIVDIIGPAIGKAIAKAYSPNLKSGDDIYVIDTNNVVRAATFISREYKRYSKNDTFLYTVSLDGVLLYVDNSKVFDSWDTAQDYADYQKECMHNAIYAAMMDNGDANKVLSDPELGAIFMAFINVLPDRDCRDHWKAAARRTAESFVKNRWKFVHQALESFRKQDLASSVIYPPFRRGKSLWEAGSCCWWKDIEEGERTVKDFLIFYKDFKEAEAMLENEESKLVKL